MPYSNEPHLPLDGDGSRRRRFRLFDSQREGRGVSKDDAKITPDLSGFFRSFWRNLPKLLSVNLLTLVGNFPLLFAIITFSGVAQVKYMTPISSLFADLHTLIVVSEGYDPALMAAYGVLGPHIENLAMTPLAYILLGLSALTFFTFGFTKVGTTYILRSLIRGEPAFMVSDFKYAIKRNWRQALPVGILDLVAMILFPVNVLLLLQMDGGFFISVLLWLNVLFYLLFLFMRPYIYLQLITFDLKISKLLKNSLIFALLGFKRNLLAIIGLLLLILFALLFIFGFGGALLPIGLAVPMVLLFSGGSYMGDFAAWFKIEQIMIAPQENEDEDAA